MFLHRFLIDPEPRREKQRQSRMNKYSHSFTPLPTLATLKSGDCAQIGYVAGGRAMIQRMAMLGIRPGVHVCILHGPGRRGAVLKVGGARVALGRGVIEQISIVAETMEHAPAPAQQ